MKVFISWSGDKSKAVAIELRTWLPSVIQVLDPWMSKEDIGAGARWSSEIATQLGESRFGVICLTKGNQSRPWIMFEAGALAKTIEGTYVVPYLIDFSAPELESGPLAQFQAKRANKEDTWELIVTLNRATSSPLPESQLRNTFEKFWPDLQNKLDNLPSEGVSTIAIRPEKDMLEEVLLTVRDLARSSNYARVQARIVSLTVSRFENDRTLHLVLPGVLPAGRAVFLRNYLIEHVPDLSPNEFEQVFLTLFEYFDQYVPFGTPGSSPVSLEIGPEVDTQNAGNT